QPAAGQPGHDGSASITAPGSEPTAGWQPPAGPGIEQPAEQRDEPATDHCAGAQPAAGRTPVSTGKCSAPAGRQPAQRPGARWPDLAIPAAGSTPGAARRAATAGLPTFAPRLAARRVQCPRPPGAAQPVARAAPECRAAAQQPADP